MFEIVVRKLRLKEEQIIIIQGRHFDIIPNFFGITLKFVYFAYIFHIYMYLLAIYIVFYTYYL